MHPHQLRNLALSTLLGLTILAGASQQAAAATDIATAGESTRTVAAQKTPTPVPGRINPHVPPIDVVSAGGRVKPNPGTSSDLTVVPEYLQPGRHTLTLAPVRREADVVRRAAASPACFTPLDDPRPSSVGFQTRTSGSCTFAENRRLAFAFDFSKLRGHTLLPLDAVLTFGESPYLQRTPEGQPVYPGGFAATCRLQLALPTRDWATSSGSISYEAPRDQQGIGRFNNILSAVAPMINDQTAESRGFILIGQNGLVAANNAACLSQISNISLTFSYAISDH